MEDSLIKGEGLGTGIVLFSNRKYLFALGTFLINLQKYISFDGVVVYHDGINEEEQTAIRNIEPKVRFVYYGLNDFVSEFGFDKEKIQSVYFIEHYTVLAAIKFKIFQHLAEFSTVMLFDLDMLLLDGLNELLEKRFDIAWRKDVSTIKDKLNNGGYSDENIRALGMYDVYSNTPTPNGGFIIARRTFDYHRVYEDSKKYIKEYGMRHPCSIDEVTFGYVGEKNDLNVYCVDEKVYNVFPPHITIKSKLIHFLADYKPWNNQMVQVVFRDWRINYEKYVEITGKPSAYVTDYSNISECLLQSHYLNNWSVLFYKYGFTYPGELKMEPNLYSSQLVFSYHGVPMYKILTSWGDLSCYCCFFADKALKCVPVDDMKQMLRKIALENKAEFEYQEDAREIGIKSRRINVVDVSNVFSRLYNTTEAARNMHKTYFCNIKTYHGTKLYLTQDGFLKHVKDKWQGNELYAGLSAGAITLFIIVNGINIFINKINIDGRVSLTSMQTYFKYVYNDDKSIAIINNDLGLLSANINGDVQLKNWNREWEHFFVQTVGVIAE